MNKTAQTKTKCDIVVDEILSMLAKGVYKENDKLPPERYFVEYFGVSRVTIRESFKKLSMLGVVRIQQGEGTFVNRVDLGTMMQPLMSAVVLDQLSVSQIYDARCYVESGMVRLAVRSASQEQLEQLDELIKAMDLEVQNKDADAFSRLDLAFHEYIAEMSQNHILAATYKTIKGILSKYIAASNLSPKTVAVSQSYHKQIVEAIRGGDEKKAAAYMEEHVELTKRNLIQQIENGETPLYVK